MKKAAFVLVLVMLLGCVSGCGAAEGEASVQSVSMICGLGSVGLADRFAGIVSPLGETTIKKNDAMTIDTIKVKVGDSVKKGDVLLTYDLSQIRTDLETLEGHILNMPRIDMPIGQAAENGLLIRQDWLDDLGLDMPNSYDEMHDVLAAFKSAYNVTDPYVMPYQVLSPWGLMSAGYGIPAVADANNFYVDLKTDKVELATISDAYYDFLCMFRDWYQEGLINPNFVSQASNIPDESIISTAKGGTVSRIQPGLTPGSVVSISRNVVDYVVTEYGIAHLRGKTVRQRRDALIAIAHPDFRQQLREEADKLMIW